MFSGLLEKLSNTYLSPTQLFLMIFGIVAAVALAATIWFYLYTSFADKGIKGSHTILKCLIASSGPLTLNLIWVLEKEIPEKFMLSVFVVSVAVLLLWNMFSVGIIKGILFTVANFVIGFIVGVSAVSVIILAIIGVVGGIISLLSGGGGGGDTGTSSIEEDMKQKYGIGISSLNADDAPGCSASDNNNSNTWIWGIDGVRSGGKRINNISGNMYADSDGNYLILTEDGKHYVDSDGNYHRVYHDVDD